MFGVFELLGISMRISFNLHLFALFAFLIMLSGCSKPLSSEEMLIKTCIDGLKDALKRETKYDGWSVKNVSAYSVKLKPDLERNNKYDTERFWLFEVLMSDFTVKNRYNADVKGFATCTGFVTRDSKYAEYDPPSKGLFTVDWDALAI